MLEIKLTVDNIDYNGIAEAAMPFVKEKLAETGNFFGGLIGNYVPENALNGAVNGFMKFLAPEQRDDILLKLISRYEENIVEAIQKAADDKGIRLEVKELSVRKS